jgi:hypothetical protein
MTFIERALKSHDMGFSLTNYFAYIILGINGFNTFKIYIILT